MQHQERDRLFCFLEGVIYTQHFCSRRPPSLAKNTLMFEYLKSLWMRVIIRVEFYEKAADLTTFIEVIGF